MYFYRRPVSNDSFPDTRIKQERVSKGTPPRAERRDTTMTLSGPLRTDVWAVWGREPIESENTRTMGSSRHAVVPLSVVAFNMQWPIENLCFVFSVRMIPKVKVYLRVHWSLTRNPVKRLETSRNPPLTIWEGRPSLNEVGLSWWVRVSIKVVRCLNSGLLRSVLDTWPTNRDGWRGGTRLDPPRLGPRSGTGHQVHARVTEVLPLPETFRVWV